MNKNKLTILILILATSAFVLNTPLKKRIPLERGKKKEQQVSNATPLDMHSNIVKETHIKINKKVDIKVDTFTSLKKKYSFFSIEQIKYKISENEDELKSKKLIESANAQSLNINDKKELKRILVENTALRVNLAQKLISSF